MIIGKWTPTMHPRTVFHAPHFAGGIRKAVTQQLIQVTARVRRTPLNYKKLLNGKQLSARQMQGLQRAYENLSVRQQIVIRAFLRLKQSQYRFLNALAEQCRTLSHHLWSPDPKTAQVMLSNARIALGLGVSRCLPKKTLWCKLPADQDWVYLCPPSVRSTLRNQKQWIQQAKQAWANFEPTQRLVATGLIRLQKRHPEKLIGNQAIAKVINATLSRYREPMSTGTIKTQLHLVRKTLGIQVNRRKSS